MRLGGDEFVVLFDNFDSPTDVEEISARIISFIAKPFRIENKDMYSGASIGIAFIESGYQTTDEVLRDSDAAMYQAKKSGKKRWVEYQVGMEKELKRLSDLSQKLSLALKNKELSLYYQPIVDISKSSTTSFEALLRWYNPELGHISPQEVIDVAEKTGLIHDIENWVLNRAIHDLCVFKQIIGQHVTMAVNISGLHMLEPNLGEYVFSLLKQNNLQPSDLTIELTESVLLTNIDSEDSPANQMTKGGIRLSIDDFGTGYSSLAYLHAIPASVVKVDKAFLNQT